jgi:uncharacterized protein (UPF0332 family)
MDGVAIFLAKARESLAGAESEFVNSRFNNCTNRCYYACLQAARAALEKAGIKPTEPRLAFGHGFIQAHFVGELIGKKKQYPPELRDTLARLLMLRQMADYETELISQTLAARALRRTEQFVAAVQEGVIT